MIAEIKKGVSGMRLSHVILVILAGLAGGSYYYQPTDNTLATVIFLEAEENQTIELLTDLNQQNENSPPQEKQTSVSVSPALAPILQKQADTYVADFAEPPSRIISVQEADHFVGRDQILKLIPQLRDLQNGEPLSPDVDEEIAIVNSLPAQSEIVLSEYNPDHSRQNHAIPIIRDKPTTTTKNISRAIPTELLDSQSGESGSNITLSQLLESTELQPESVFYVKTVNKSDQRGIWGIIVDGITQNFAQGIAIRRGENIDNYKLDIPHSADRLRADSSSSFLGQMVHRKSIDSHVYNFRKNRMGQNPHLIYPGQELVIVNFKPEELSAIYSHFVESSEFN